MKRRKQQDLLFRSLGLGQQEEKQLQSKLQSIQEALTLIGSVLLFARFDRSLILVAAMESAIRSTKWWPR